MKGVSFFRWWGFSINEGAGPVNIHLSWRRSHRWKNRNFRLFFYLFLNITEGGTRIMFNSRFKPGWLVRTHGL